MKKTVVAPGQGVVESDELDEPQTSLAVATHREHCTSSSTVSSTATATSASRRASCSDSSGRSSRTSTGPRTTSSNSSGTSSQASTPPGTRGTVQEVQSRFVDRPHYPAGCVVQTPAIPVDGALLELDATATVPDDGWTVETITGDE